MDTLSDVLRAVRLTGAIYFSIEASDPWVAEVPVGTAIAPHIVPGVEHVIGYHVITGGTCWGGALDEAAVQLHTGDVIVFPQGDPHVMSSTPGMRAAPNIDLYRAMSEAPLPMPLVIQGGGADQTRVICGYMGCDARPFNPLLASLPRMIHLRHSADGDTTLRRLVDLALAESRGRRPGSDGVLARLSELLFVEMVRRYLDTLPAGQIGWFAGLRDEGVGRALQKLHERPAFAWSLEQLARETALSRSVLAERFTQLVGVPPMQYLTQWRIQLAANLLRTGTAGIAEIAERVGYGSEGALSRAFKRWVGMAPAPYRRGEAVAAPRG
jgi:AraC-like DNA-binding protein